MLQIYVNSSNVFCRAIRRKIFDEKLAKSEAPRFPNGRRFARYKLAVDAATAVGLDRSLRFALKSKERLCRY